jgi:UDP:flavonoid glycosyltransferase YjiC (YdhE family)
VPRIAFAVELGGELGHVRACGALANTLSPRGHEIAFVLSDLHSPEGLSVKSPHPVFRVPSGDTAVNPKPVSYAEILVGCGYASAATLAPLAQAWRMRLEAIRPDVVVADYAPTAMLAARVIGIPCINFGMGFTVPPRLTPLPSFRFDEPVDPKLVERADAQALATVNGVLAAWGEKPLERLAQLMDCEEEFLCTFPELDHYGNRPASGYWGPRYETGNGVRHAWPARGGKRIFLYVKTMLPQLDALLAPLAASSHRTAAFIPRLDESRRARYSSPAHHISLDPIRLDGLLPECDLAITHGGQLSGGIAALGIPQLVFPLQFEQYITARRIQQMGCGIWLGPRAGAAEIAATLTELLANPAHTLSARAFARRYPAFSLNEQRRRMVARIEQVAGRGSPILSADPSKEAPNEPR